jgi:hypothetical protein
MVGFSFETALNFIHINTIASPKPLAPLAPLAPACEQRAPTRLPKVSVRRPGISSHSRGG